MNDARPHGEPDQTQVGFRLTGCPQQEYAERGVDSDDHLLVLMLARLPGPAGGLHAHERIDEKERDTEDHQNSAEESVMIVHHGRSVPFPYATRVSFAY